MDPRDGVVSAIALCIVGITAAAVNPSLLVLQLEDAETGERLGSHAIGEGERFEVRYVHSFEGTEIRETYTAEDEGIVQVREAYEYHAAGLEFTRETYREDGWIVSDVERELGCFTVRVAGSTEQSLVVGGTERSLEAYAEPGTGIELSIERTSRAEHHATNTRTR
ncbi:DUF1850 domain-containing protein [Halalkalicoccus tibetensis]|uniref:DUF1850 domain-containing protein n=1 Tax=Halalkalicoccus tibetensis TaxID=175632 RepID=A0ABD5V8G7_9EURY